MVDSKMCYSCGKIKSKDNFYKSKTVKSGLQSTCKECESKSKSERKKRLKNEIKTVRPSELEEDSLYKQRVHKKKPDPRPRTVVRYDFLKYIKVVYKFTIEQHPKLNRSEIDFLLYLYGQGVFSRSYFNNYHRIVGMYEMKTLSKFMKDGYIKVWRPRKGKSCVLYSLTTKAKSMCSDMHKFLVGDKEIPMIKSQNKLLGKGKPRIFGYYTNLIKQMNEGSKKNT